MVKNMSECSHAKENMVSIRPIGEKPGILTDIPMERVEILDVRPMVRTGHKPCSAIAQAIEDLPKGKILHLINSFQPGSLYRRLEEEGWNHWTEQHADDEWHVWFYRM
jgi:uncharacterized protein (DUF2249 family)